MKRKSVKWLKDRLWKYVADYIKRRDGNRCFTCGDKCGVGVNFQCGHCVPKSIGGVVLHFMPLNLAPQDSKCNLTGDGMGAIFGNNLQKKHGYNVVSYFQEIRLKTKNWNWKRKDLESHIAFFENGGEDYDAYYAAWLSNAIQARDEYGNETVPYKH